ncbi:hypothetical protein KOR42_11460 [Thalassoglobus neptunius]|uniref:Uncharacterized protein n=1 Tax=Thalassoglobus neptunius TaxID=1938619 RepID=A0A5C5X4G5_9PLAN|nr:hypothetical protein KOR42_11460 [Thalassoglobus neptunius]
MIFENNAAGSKFPKWVWWLGLGVAVSWLLVSPVIRWLSCDWSEAGTIGDSFGAVNALFSGLAFVGLIYTILLQSKQLAQNSEVLEMQREELGLQREELKLTREELAKSAVAQVKSSEITRTIAILNANSILLEFHKLAADRMVGGHGSTWKTRMQYRGDEEGRLQAKYHLEKSIEISDEISTLLEDLNSKSTENPST